MYLPKWFVLKRVDHDNVFLINRFVSCAKVQLRVVYKLHLILVCITLTDTVFYVFLSKLHVGCSRYRIRIIAVSFINALCVNYTISSRYDTA